MLIILVYLAVQFLIYLPISLWPFQRHHQPKFATDYQKGQAGKIILPKYKKKWPEAKILQKIKYIGFPSSRKNFIASLFIPLRAFLLPKQKQKQKLWTKRFENFFSRGEFFLKASIQTKDLHSEKLPPTSEHKFSILKTAFYPVRGAGFESWLSSYSFMPIFIT